MVVRVLWSARRQRIHQVDFSARAHARSQRVEVVADLQRSGSGGADPPHPAGSHQHFTGILRVQNVWSIEGSLISAQIGRAYDLEKSSVVTSRSQLTFQNREIGVRRKPLVGVRRIDRIESAISAERVLPDTIAGCTAGF